MLLSTTPTIEGHTIREYKGIVTGETIIGANFMKDFFAGIRDIIGGRVGQLRESAARGKRHGTGRDAATRRRPRCQRCRWHRHRLRDRRTKRFHAHGGSERNGRRHIEINKW